jgi:hypothetical protein
MILFTFLLEGISISGALFTAVLLSKDLFGCGTNRTNFPDIFKKNKIAFGHPIVTSKTLTQLRCLESLDFPPLLLNKQRPKLSV